MWRNLVLLLFWFHSFTCTVRLLFHGLVTFSCRTIKQVYCRMSAKNLNNYKQNTFCDIFGQLHTQQYKVTKKKVLRFQLNEKKSKESKTILMSWYRKRKPTRRKDLITYNIHPWIMFSFNQGSFDWLSFG